MFFTLKTHLPVLAILIFLLITFGISVLEKCMDWKGTVSYISHNFKDTFIKKIISPLLLILLGLEILTCVFLIYGLYQILVYKNSDYTLLGFIFSAGCILYMLIGQRIAKDYVGATSLTVYFILTVFGICLLV